VTDLASNCGETARRGPGRPFEKGQSGNPSGRPKVAEAREALRRVRGKQSTPSPALADDGLAEGVTLDPGILVSPEPDPARGTGV
jgi:hypothetical protein